jgi:hypothetical protein
MTHRTGDYTAKFSSAIGKCIDATTKTELRFDLSKDHPETLLIHDQLGGGYTGIDALSRMSLIKSAANQVGDRVSALGPDYDAIHIRHSDYRTDYQNLLRRAAPLFAGRRLLVCSDSARVKAEAAALLGPRVEVLSIANTPNTGEVPLHARPKGLDRSAANIDLLSELVAMARAKRFVFSAVLPPKPRPGQPPQRRAQFSGLSVLAEMLRISPEVLPGLFAKADPEVFAALFAAEAVESQTDTLANRLRRRLGELHAYRWNAPALVEARLIGRIAQEARTISQLK